MSGKFKIKSKKIQPKQVFELKELRDNRGEFHGFIMNFIMNISSRIDVIDIFRENNDYRKNNTRFKVAVGQYIASLITCWETLFRDVLVSIVQVDDSIYEKVKLHMEKNDVNITDIESKDISIGEFVSKQYNLQNIDSIGEAFNFLFDENYDTIFEYFSNNLVGNLYFTSQSYIMLLIHERESMPKEIEKIIRGAFAIRHKVIHDANFYLNFDAVEMTKMEECLIMFPQLLIAGLTHKYKQRGLVFNHKETYMRLTDSPTKDEGLYMIGTKEIRAKDWQMVD